MLPRQLTKTPSLTNSTTASQGRENHSSAFVLCSAVLLCRSWTRSGPRRKWSMLCWSGTTSRRVSWSTGSCTRCRSCEWTWSGCSTRLSLRTSWNTTSGESGSCTGSISWSSGSNQRTWRCWKLSFLLFQTLSCQAGWAVRLLPPLCSNHAAEPLFSTSTVCSPLPPFPLRRAALV